jgi:hypothetical protein
MSKLDNLVDLNAWVSLATAIACLAFIATYAALARWWVSYEGRIMMTTATAIMALSAYTFAVVHIVPESTVLRVIRIVVVAAIGIVMIFQTVRVVRIQIKRRHSRKEGSNNG